MKIKNRQQWLALLAGAVVALFAADKLLITPLTASWKQRAAQITDLRKKVSEGRALLQRESSLRSRLAQMRANTLPNDRSQAEEQMLKGVERWSGASRVTILSLSPQWKQEAEDRVTLECRLEASGDLGAVSRFLYEVESDPMALRVQSVEITARDNDGRQMALGLQISGLVSMPETQKRQR